MAYRKIEKTGWRPYQFDTQKALWRNSASLFDFMGDVNKSPQTLGQLRNMSLSEHFGDKKMMVLGWCCDKAKVHQWRHERFPLPMDYLSCEELVVCLESALHRAEELGAAVRQAIWSLSRNLLSPWENMEKTPDKDAVSSLAKSFPSLSHFWSSLEPHFHALYTGIPTDSDAALEQWKEAIKNAAWEGLELTLRGLDGSARSLQAAVKARQSLGGSIKKLIPKKEEFADV